MGMFVTYGILAALSIGAVIVALRFVKNAAGAAAIAATVVSLAFQVGAFIDLGYMDPFAPIALVVSWAYSFTIAILFAVSNKKQKSLAPPNGS